MNKQTHKASVGSSEGGNPESMAIQEGLKRGLTIMIINVWDSLWPETRVAEPHRC